MLSFFPLVAGARKDRREHSQHVAVRGSFAGVDRGQNAIPDTVQAHRVDDAAGALGVLRGDAAAQKRSVDAAAALHGADAADLQAAPQTRCISLLVVLMDLFQRLQRKVDVPLLRKGLYSRQ